MKLSLGRHFWCPASRRGSPPGPLGRSGSGIFEADGHDHFQDLRIIFFDSSPHRGEVLHVHGLTSAVESDDDGEADSDFGGSHRDDEEDEDLSVVVGKAVGADIESGKRDEREICGAQHELQTHEDDNCNRLG